MEWVRASERIPKLDDKGYIYSPIKKIIVKVEVTRSPILSDDFLYWHFMYPDTKELGWVRIMPSDLWKLRD